MSLIEAKPREQDQKKGADKGIDGTIFFLDGIGGKETKKIIIQVKSGHVSSRDIRDLKGVLPREKAEIGLFITLEEPTRDMNTEAVSAGSYPSTVWNRNYPRLQIRTIADLLGGKGFELPPRPGQFKQAARAKDDALQISF